MDIGLDRNETKLPPSAHTDFNPAEYHPAIHFQATTSSIKNTGNTVKKAPPRPKRQVLGKKIAVKKTSDARVISLLQRNRENSPLLGLPPEVLTSILSYVVCDKLIHVRYYKHEHFNERCAKQHKLWNPSVPRVFRHCVCLAKPSEDTAYEHSRFGSPSVPQKDDPEYYVESFMDRHAPCLRRPAFLPTDFQNIAPSPSPLFSSLLAVSRQIYGLANYLLYATNTFSFNDAISFYAFMKSLHRAQKRKITKLHLCIPWNSVPSKGSISWTGALQQRQLRALKGLQSLTICLEDLNEDRHQLHLRLVEGGFSKFWNGEWHGSDFHRFQQVPLRQGSHHG